MAPKKKPAKKKAAPKKPVTKKKAAPKKAAVLKVAETKPVKSRKILKPKNANGSFTQGEFIEQLQAFCGIAKRAQAKELIADIQELLTDSLKQGYKVPLFGLGKITVRKSKKRKGRNPATGAEIIIPARKKVRFTPAKSLKEAVL
jgi:DNA-binding protein HU-beta